jgi:tetratricopeptide (TPR) repeat protein
MKMVFIVLGFVVMTAFIFTERAEAAPFYFVGFQAPYYANNGKADTFNEPSDLYGYLDRAVAYILQGEYAKAVADCNTAAGMWEGYPPAIGTRSTAYLNAKEYDKAIADLNYLIENYGDGESPSDAWLYYMRGKAYAGKGTMSQARIDYNEALRLDSAYAQLENYAR